MERDKVKQREERLRRETKWKKWQQWSQKPVSKISNSWKVNSLFTLWRLIEDWRHGSTHSRSRWRWVVSTTPWPLYQRQQHLLRVV